MATWKQVLTSDSTINVEQLDGIASDAQDAVLTIDGSGNAAAVTLTEAHVLSGNGSNQPTVQEIGGDLSASTDGSVLSLSIDDDAVDSDAIADDAVGLNHLAHSAGHGILVYDDNATDGDGVPTFLAGGTAGQVVKVNADADGFEFADGDSASTVDIDQSTGTPGPIPVLFGGSNVATDDTGQTLLKQQSINNFTFDADQAFSVATGQPAVGSFTGGAAALTVVGGVKADLLGTATFASQVPFTDASATDDFLPVAIAAAATGYQDLHTDAAISFNPAEETLKVKNLIVSGTNTVINTTNLNVDDQTIRVGTSSTSVTTSDAAGGGLVVNIGVSTATSGNEDALTQTNEDRFLPRVLWGDQTFANSTLGWQIAREGAASTAQDAPDNLLTASNLWGVAVMYHNNTAGVDTASEADAAVNSGNGIGVGALYFNTAEDTLWIQTAV